jgi:hypothetical protein
MKSAPSLMAAVTAVAALAGTALLAAEDRMLFEPQHAMLVGLADELGEVFIEEPAARVPAEARRSVTRAGSAVQDRR